jgi:aspartyl protease family protein
MAIWVALGLLLVAGTVLVAGEDSAMLIGLTPSQLAGVATGGALLVFIGAQFWRRYDGGLLAAGRDLLIWSAVGLGLIAVYSFRGEIGMVAQRVGTELTPAGTVFSATSPETGERAVRLRKRDDGHFVARAQANGETLQLLIDTGASSIVLRPSDAERAGIDLATLNYVVPINTANGTAFAAPVRLRSLAVGPLSVTDIEALVTRPGVLSESLLGMSFLSRLRAYEVSGDYLTLRG